MPIRLAVAGFRHGHIMSVYNQARTSEEVELVATCEEDPDARAKLIADGTEISHSDFQQLLDEVDCDIVAIGDYYTKRGAMAIAALEAGKHVIADKPLCTSLDELQAIERLASEKGLCVGCQLDLRQSGKYLALRRVLREEQLIGDIHAISFGGQHPLNFGSRPGWYFEQGKHGGTIIDIAIHGIDLIPWLTGLQIARIEASRNWNAICTEVPHFRDSAQFMLTLDNGCGVLGDVSYLTPDAQGYSFPLYWRWTFWGSEGVIEIDTAHTALMLYPKDKTGVQELMPEENGPGTLQALLAEIAGKPASPSTAEVIASTRTTLQIQQAADEDRHGISLN